MAVAKVSSSSRLLAWLQLMRLPNVFTAMADVMMGFLVTHATFEPLGVFALLLLASSCLYIGGMVLNDVCDVEIDRIERPQRPLPSSRASQKSARRLAWSLLALGVAAACVVTLLKYRDWTVLIRAPGFAIHGDMRAAVVAISLVVYVFAYNRWIKHTWGGPLVMGSCRALNVLLGMSASPQPWTAANWTIAGGVGLYIVGVTWFSRGEAARSQRIHLAAALATMLAGMAILWWSPRLMPEASVLPMLRLRPESWTALWLFLAAIIGWRALRAILRPEPGYVQAAVKTGILSIIVLDAVVVFAVRGPAAAIAVLLLLVPTIVLGWWIYST